MALVAAALVGPSFVDWNTQKSRLATEVQKATGRQLTIEGDMSLALLPAPALSANSVSFQNIDGGTEASMIQLEELKVRVALWPLLQGQVQFESVSLVRPRILLEALPRFIHIKDYGHVSPGWLDETLKIIAAEVGHDQLGTELIALKLSEIIFTQAIRHYLANEGQNRPGIAGFADIQIRQALEAIHENPARGWTVQSLARIAGLSRTKFATRFAELVANTPLNYLTEWRMQIARQLLIDTDIPIIEVAERIGYHSEAAFGRSFKRHFETPPASYRRARSDSPTVH